MSNNLLSSVQNKDIHFLVYCLVRVLSKEVGGASLELNKSLDDESGWKGRAQHIVLLKTRIRQLETQLRNSEQVKSQG